MFIEEIKRKASLNKKWIVLPESEDERTIRAAASALEDDTAYIILLGDELDIKESASEYGVNIAGAKIINPKTSDKIETYTNLLYELRKSKGMTLEKAHNEVINNKTMFAVLMVKAGDADGLVSGACHSTADILRPTLQVIKTAPGIHTASAAFVFDIPNCEYGEDGVILCADCALTQDPTSAQLAEIGISSARTFEALVGKEARVAFLSHSTKGSAKHAMIDKVTEAVRLAHELDPTVKLDGELQLDAALVADVAKSKAPESEVAGKANVLIFPNLDAANIGYKLIQRLAKAEAYSLLQGLDKPANDLSRGCFFEDIAGVIAITVLQAQ